MVLGNVAKVIQTLLETGMKFRSVGLSKHVLSRFSLHVGLRKDDLEPAWRSLAWICSVKAPASAGHCGGQVAERSFFSVVTPHASPPTSSSSCAFVPEVPAWTLLGPQIPVGTSICPALALR